jgi:hypothetical protein
MKRMLSLCAAAAILSCGSASLANDAAAVSQTAQDQTMATLVCRPAGSGESPSATTEDKVALVCKPLDMNPIMAMKPHIEAAPNGEQMWQDLMNDLTLKGGH